MKSRRQRGFTLIETAIFVGVMAILIPVLASIIFQFFRIPRDQGAALDVTNELRQAERWVNLDGSRAQSFVLAAAPDYGTFGWHDFTVSPPVRHEIRYFFRDGELIREERVDGTVASTVTAAEGLARYEDLVIVACPTFVRLNLTITFEGATRTFSQNREFFLRLRAEPLGEVTSQPLGHALFAAGLGGDKVFRYSAAGTFLGTLPLTSANTNSKGITTDGTSFWVLDKKERIVARYDMSGQFQDSFALTTPVPHLEGIAVSGTVLWVLDRDTGVARYSTSGFSLDESFSLADENSHAEGIASDGTDLWVVDKNVDKVLRYSSAGELLGSFSVAPATHPEGVVTDGASLWVVDKDTDTTYRFDLTGALLDSFALDLGNDKAGGLTRTPAGELWVVDGKAGDEEPIRWTGSDSLVAGNVHSNGDIFVGGSDNTVTDAVTAHGVLTIQGQGHSFGSVEALGGLLSSFSVAPATHPEGAVTDGSSLWVVDKDTDTIYEFDLSGTPLGSFALAAQNGKASGLTRTPSGALWVVDEESGTIFQYSAAGVLLDTLPLTPANGQAKGLTTDGSNVWVLDKEDRAVYRYDMSGALLYSFALTTPSDHPEGITLDGASLWVLDKDAGVARYSTVGVFQGESFGLDAENSHAEGIAAGGGSLWVVDEDADRLFRYSPAPAPSRPLPVNCSLSDFPAPTFSWTGDVILTDAEDVWEDWPLRTRLKPGIYRATGKISLGRNSAVGTVTLIADQVHVSGDAVELQPFYAGITLFGTGTGNDTLKVSGHSGQWRGMLYAPQGEVNLAASTFTLNGSIVAESIKSDNQGTRILHSAY